MPIPHFCPNPSCRNHTDPPHQWRIRYGSYTTSAHGDVQRYQCRACGSTMSDQTESLHYFAKRRLPLKAVTDTFCSGASLREIARRYHVSPMAVQNGLLRIGRQAMAAQLHLLASMNERSHLVFDGLRSCVTSQDYPCDITTVVDAAGETILTMTHSVFTRGGRKTRKQERRTRLKYRVWRPEPGSVSRDISLLVNELWDYLRPKGTRGVLIDTDEHPLYLPALKRNPVARHFATAGLLTHRRTPGSAPRTIQNPLFPVNYVDRLVRHRVKEHMRETIALGRNSTMQMHRAWIFAWDHNVRREYRVRRPNEGAHAVQGTIDRASTDLLCREFFRRRLRIRGLQVPESIRRVWLGELPTPPVRWRGTGQHGTNIRIPRYAERELPAAA